MSVWTRSACLVEPGKIELFEQKLECGPNEVIVKNIKMGICGSDKNFFRGFLPKQTNEFRQKPEYPFLLGHESGGIVTEVGSKVSGFGVGDKVMSFGWNNNFGDYFKAPASDILIAPQELTDNEVTLGEPISCAMHSGLNSKVQLGDVVVVLGLGFAGQIIAQCVKQKGARLVIGIDVSAAKMEIAKTLGTDIIIDAMDEELIQIVMNKTDGAGADVVVEVAGTEESMNIASKIVRKNGKIVLYSWITQPILMDISRWHDDGISIVNTCLVHHTREERDVWTKAALRPIQYKMISIEPLISAMYSLDEINEAFQYALTDEPIKIMLKP